MNSVLKDIIENGTIKGHDGKSKQLHSHVAYGEGMFCQEMISKTRGEVSREVGLAYGISALFICDALIKTVKTRHIIIDPYQFIDWDGIGLNNLKMAGYENSIEFHESPGHIALAQLETREAKVDFAFIDGFHTFDYALIDFFYIDRILRVGGIVALHDTNMRSIKKLCKYILTNRAYSLVGYYGTLKDGIPERRISRVIRFFLTPFITTKRIEYFVKLGFFGGINVIAFRKESEDTRDWDFHRYF